jgi:hypothetical protein
MLGKGDGICRANAEAFVAFVAFVDIEFNEFHYLTNLCNSSINLHADSGETEQISLSFTWTETASEHFPKQKDDFKSILFSNF